MCKATTPVAVVMYDVYVTWAVGNCQHKQSVALYLQQVDIVCLFTVGASKQHIDSIRTRYGRDKKEYLCPPSGSARKKPPPNEKIFMCRLKFLFKHITPRPSRNSLTNRKLVRKYMNKEIVKNIEEKVHCEILPVINELNILLWHCGWV